MGGFTYNHDKRRAPHLLHILDVQCRFEESLSILNNLYRPRLEQYTHTAGAALSQSDVEFIFRGLHDIIGVNSQFKETITASIVKDDALSLGSTFLYFAHSFKIFDTYVCKFDQAMELIRKAQRKSEKFRVLLDSIQIEPEAQGQDLASLMIRPVQLLPRFSLLIRDLMKYTDPDFPGMESLVSALELVDSVSETVNMHIADYQNRQKLLTLRESIRGCPEELLQPHRTVVRTGVLDKVCRNSVEPRFICLLSDSILYAGVIRPVKSQPETAIAASESLTQPYVFHRQIPLVNSRTLSIKEFQANVLRLIHRFNTGFEMQLSEQASASTPETGDSSDSSVEHTSPPTQQNSAGIQRTVDVIKQIADPALCFILVTPDKSFILKAKSAAEASTWRCAVDEVCSSVELLAQDSPQAMDGVRRGRARRHRLPSFLLGHTAQESSSTGGVPQYIAPVWIPDSLAPNCMSCGTEFTQFRRRHHCRLCGAVICGSCSPHRRQLSAYDRPQRVCEMCYHDLVGETDLPQLFTDNSLTDVSSSVVGSALAYPAGFVAEECPFRPGLPIHKVAASYLRCEQFQITQYYDNSKDFINELYSSFSVLYRAAQAHAPPPAPPLVPTHPFSLGGILNYTLASLSGNSSSVLLAQYYTPDENPPHQPLEGDIVRALKNLPQMRKVEEMHRKALGMESPWDVRCEYEHYRLELEAVNGDIHAPPPILDEIVQCQ